MRRVGEVERGDVFEHRSQPPVQRALEHVLSAWALGLCELGDDAPVHGRRVGDHRDRPGLSEDARRLLGVEDRRDSEFPGDAREVARRAPHVSDDAPDPADERRVVGRGGPRHED